MKTILYVSDEDRYSFRRRLSGICRCARTQNLRVRTVNVASFGLTVADALSIVKPKGMIVEQTVIERFRIPLKTLRRVPTVIADITRPEIDRGLTGVRLATDAETRAATDALLALDLPGYAFVSYARKSYWNVAREKFFRTAMARHGRRADVFLPYSHGGGLPAVLARLGDWLEDLPKPCGLLAANDEVGDAVIEVANARGIRIPDEIAVIGIDNDEFICRNTVPPLASVAPDFEHSGSLAVEMLAEMIRSPGVTPKTGTYHSGDVVLRRSLRPFKAQDDVIVDAVDYIHRRACDGIGVQNVIAHIGTRTRSAQQRFLKLTGHTIFDEIEAVRFDRACTLLRRSGQKIGLIHRECGYGTDRAFRNAFQKRTGLSPSDWRLRHT